MCRRLVLFVCFVLVMAGAASANLLVTENTTTTLDSDLTDAGYVAVVGHLIVNAGNIEFGSQSWINGPNNVGTGGTRPEITVNGGNLDINARLDMGTGSDAYLTMNDGNFTVVGDLKLPDNAGGTHRIWLNGGTLRVNALQLVADRDAQIVVGGGVLELEDIPTTSTGSYDPTDWLTAINPAIGEPALVPAEGFVKVVIDYNVPVVGGATVTAIESGLYAENPNPADAATRVCPNGVVLSWKPADEITDPNHDLYLDPNFNNVAGATRDTNETVEYYSENQDSNEYTVLPALLPGTTYYWRVDEVNTADPCVWESPIIWSFTTEDGNAYDPDPPDGRRGVNPAEVVLNWSPSCFATAQTVYFSTDWNDVNEMIGGQALNADDNNYPVGPLATYTTYYWRIKTDSGGNGEVWEFKTGYGGLLMQYSFEGSLGADITDPVVDDTGKLTFTRYEGGGTLKYGEGRFGGTSALFDSNVGLYRPDPNGPNESDYLRLDGYQYSIHLWVKPTYLSGLDMTDQRLIGKRPGPWGIWINNPGSGEGRNNSFRFVHAGPGSDNADTANNTAREDEWVHLAAVYNQPDYDVYLNGIWAAGMSRPPLPSDNNNPIGIGCRIQQPDPGTYVFSQFFDGFIDELKIWDIAVLPVLACSTDPSPPHLADRLDPCDANNTVLSWTPGPFADRHDVYFGTDPCNPVYLGTTVDGGNMWPESGNLVLEQGKTYYWRIDDVNDGDAKTYEGLLWNFTTESIPVDPNMVLWYRFDELYGDDVTDSSGYYNHGEINRYQSDTWDPCDGRFYPGCIHFHNSERIDVVGEVFGYIGESISISVWWKQAYRVGDENYFCGFGDADFNLLVRAPDSQPDNPGVIWRAGNDTNDVLEWTTNGDLWSDDWHHLVFTKNGPEGTMKIYFDTVQVAWTPLASGDTLSQAAARATRGFRIGANWNNTADFVGKADDFRVYDYEIPQEKIDELFRGGDVALAWGPTPYDGRQDAPYDTDLIWNPGDWFADTNGHDVYFGTDWDEVNDANSSDHPNVEYHNLDVNAYDIPYLLELDQTYYWRVDGNNDACQPEPWKGKVWRFRVADYIIIDDMEDYTLTTDYPIAKLEGAATWGWDDIYAHSSSNAFLNLVYPGWSVYPEIEAHRSDQAMYYLYYNSELPYYSEISNHFTLDPNDWTVAGVKMLVLWFLGTPGNDADEPMYVGLEDEDGAGSYAQVNYGDYGEDPNDVRVAEWQAWLLALSDFTDDNPSLELEKMQKLYIGFGDRDTPAAGGDGEMFFDNIRLYQPICVPSRRSAAFAKLDFDEDCIIGFGDVEVMSADWLESDINLGEVTNPTDTNLVGWWKLDDGDGNIATDSSVYSNHGTVETNTVNVDWVIGRNDVNYALEFSGGRVLVQDAPELRPLHQVSAAAWINYSETLSNARVVVKGPDNRETYWLEVGGNDQLRFAVRDGNDPNYPIHNAGGGVLPQDEWVHVAGTYDGNSVKTYIDGVLVAENYDANSNVIPFLSQDINDLAIGSRAESFENPFYGIIDDVRVYDRGLTAAEIGYLASDGTGIVVIESTANLIDAEAPGERAVNMRDFAILADEWLMREFWP